MTDRLLSFKTVVQAVVILVVAGGAGLTFNAVRGDSAKKIALSKQNFLRDVLRNDGAIQEDPKVSEKPPRVKGPGPEVSNPPPETGNGAAPVPDPPAVTETPEPPVEHADGIQRMQVLDCKDLLGSDIAVFVDARKKADYVEGHIPGAVHLYHYTSMEKIDTVRSDLEAAFMIIVYCNGGDCEDSINLALDLTTNYGFPNESVYVFEGGMEEWRSNEFPVVEGENRD